MREAWERAEKKTHKTTALREANFMKSKQKIGLHYRLCLYGRNYTFRNGGRIISNGWKHHM